jgi:hypothetical protein
MAIRRPFFLRGGGRPALLGVEAYLGCVIQATLSLL